MTANEIIQSLQLAPHPEGGWYKEVYRSTGTLPVFGGERSYCTSIYYLLQAGDFSAFHRIKSDELWHFYAGGSLILHMLNKDGYRNKQLGVDLRNGKAFQVLMPAGCWFAAEPAPGTDFTLSGCTVSPGFDFRDFEMANKKALLKEFPEKEELIMRLCRE